MISSEIPLLDQQLALVGGAIGLQLGLGEPAHATADLPVEVQLIRAPDPTKAGSQQEWAGPGRLGHGAQVEPDVPGVEPLPDPVVHLPLLEVPLQGPVVPADD